MRSRDVPCVVRQGERTEGITVLVATHDPALIELADAAPRLDDGIHTEV